MESLPDPNRITIRHQACAWCSVWKHPETFILTSDILIFCSPALLVNLASGTLMKRRTKTRNSTDIKQVVCKRL